MFEWLELQLAKSLVYPIYKVIGDGGSRYFWLYVLAGCLISLVLWWRQQEAAPTAQRLLAREVWWSRSAQNDYLIVATTGVLRFTVLSWAFIHYKEISALVVAALRAIGVSGEVNGGEAMALGLVLTLTLFVVDDFMRFFEHYLMHKVPELWEFHKVHHSAEHLNFATADRIHPAELVISGFLTAITVGTVNGVFIAFFGDKLTVETVFGANVFLVVFNICGGVLRHSPVWLSFGPAVERWVISPAMHQIHHSENPKHFDKNLGGALAVWDRMFGTLYIPNGREVESFGIGEETRDFRDPGVIFLRPFVRSFALLRTRFDTLRVAVRAPARHT
ncbi:MAG: sterol desaturase family protein [Hyphomicrobiaceae bacterium]|nr:sterol desaturase family protein [Hyphomicrobiaceae bacterium]